MTKQCALCKKPYDGLGKSYCSRSCWALASVTTIESILSRIQVHPTTGCHLWLGCRDSRGYGRVTINQKLLFVHRVVWKYFKGDIPAGMVLDHLCLVPRCCNPEHIRVTTLAENTMAPGSRALGAVNSRKTCCSKCGGPFSRRKTGRKQRFCPACNRVYDTNLKRRYRELKELH
jgi:HNH endonuclease